jgi:hypothetical protein
LVKMCDTFRGVLAVLGDEADVEGGVVAARLEGIGWAGLEFDFFGVVEEGELAAGVGVVIVGR